MQAILAVSHLRGIMEWISVKDRLPEFDKTVLVFLKGFSACGFSIKDSIKPGVLSIDRGWLVDNFMVGNITHWQPLPEPPK
jgi:hypothetical protein